LKYSPSAFDRGNPPRRTIMHLFRKGCTQSAGKLDGNSFLPQETGTALGSAGMPVYDVKKSNKSSS